MGDSVMVLGDSEPLTEGAWLLPLATMPLAVTLVCASTGLSPLEAWQEGGVWLGAIGLAGLMSSLYSARIIAAASTPNGPPPALAIVPFVVPHFVALLATRFWLAQIFVAQTYCGPATRDEAITWSLAETLLFRVTPLFISCAGFVTVALATIFVSRRLEPRERWMTISATSALGWAIAVAALSVTFLRRELVGMLEVSTDPEASWLQVVVAHFRDYAEASNTLMLAAIVFAAAAMFRSSSGRDGRTGVVTLCAVLVGAIGTRGAVVLDEIQLKWQFDEFPIYETVRPLAPENTGWSDLSLDTWRPASETVTDQLASWSASGEYLRAELAAEVKAAHAKGVPVPWPVGLSADSDIPTGEFRRALRRLREGGVSDLIFHSPLTPFGRAPGALRPLVEFQNSFDWSDALSIRFSDEPMCQATNLRSRPLVSTAQGSRSAWRLDCEAVSVDDVTVENLHSFASSALARGHRLVVLLSRLQP
ncbi:MAG: hypothetical protein Q8L48_09465 [Archangium sp.]|nr:hypothetical protein [Archangium sp.]